MKRHAFSGYLVRFAHGWWITRWSRCWCGLPRTAIVHRMRVR